MNCSDIRSTKTVLRLNSRSDRPSLLSLVPLRPVDEIVEEDGLCQEDEAHSQLRALVGIEARAVPHAVLSKTLRRGLIA